jgi:hypothetical protein
MFSQIADHLYSQFDPEQHGNESDPFVSSLKRFFQRHLDRYRLLDFLQPKLQIWYLRDLLGKNKKQMTKEYRDEVCFHLLCLGRIPTARKNHAMWIRQQFHSDSWPTDILSAAHKAITAIEMRDARKIPYVDLEHLVKRLQIYEHSVPVLAMVDSVGRSFVVLSFQAPHRANGWVEREFRKAQLPADIKPGDQVEIVAKLHPSGALQGYETSTDANALHSVPAHPPWGSEWPEPPANFHDKSAMKEYANKKDAHFKALWDNA